MFKLVVICALVVAASARPEVYRRVQRSPHHHHHHHHGGLGLGGSIELVETHSAGFGGGYPGGYFGYPGGYGGFPGGYGGYGGYGSDESTSFELGFGLGK